MKTIRLLLVSVLASIGLAASAQSYLPQKSAFSIGGGFMWGFKEGKGDFQEVTNTPTLNQFDTAIILNQQSMDKFEASVKPGGLLIYDPNGISHHPTRKDINIYQVAAADKASEIGIMKLFNMIILGGFLAVKPIVTREMLEKGLQKSLPERHHHLIPDNIKAVEIGKGLLTPFNVL
mgnify:CR=1 FL=1